MPASQIDDDIGPLPEHAGNTLLPADAAVRRALVDGRQRILGYLLRRLGDRDVAEEVFQRFVLRALEHSAEINDVAAVHGWLGRVLASAVADRQRDEARRRRRETATGEEDLARLTVAPEQEAVEAVCACLHALLPTVRPAYADLVRRVDLLGEPRARAARNLGISLDTLAVRLHRARQALRRRLEEMCLTCPVHGFLDCRCEEAKQVQARLGKRKAERKG